MRVLLKLELATAVGRGGGFSVLCPVHILYISQVGLESKCYMFIGHNVLQSVYGLEDNAGCGLRRMRTRVDTRESQPFKLPFQEVPLDALGQGRRRWQNAGSPDQGGS
jgi:hypothetical protein